MLVSVMQATIPWRFSLPCVVVTTHGYKLSTTRSGSRSAFVISCFDIITATAVALLEFTDRGVDVNIFADVIAQMPPNIKQRDVELLLNADLNFIDD
jgi:hypothetical protein